MERQPGVTGDNDTWSLRLGGLLDTAAMAGDKVKFRVFSDDGVRLSVEGATILDCFADDHPNETEANCGEGDVSKVVWGNTASTIEYADHTGDAALDVQWDQGNGTWQTSRVGRSRPTSASSHRPPRRKSPQGTRSI